MFGNESAVGILSMDFLVNLSKQTIAAIYKMQAFNEFTFQHSAGLLELGLGGRIVSFGKIEKMRFGFGSDEVHQRTCLRLPIVVLSNQTPDNLQHFENSSGFSCLCVQLQKSFSGAK